MELQRYVDELQHQLATAAAAGSDETQDLARRLTAPLDAATRLVLLSALSDAAAEISADLAPGSVDVRLRAGNPEFVVDAPAPQPATARESTPEQHRPPLVDLDGTSTSRTTLRLPDQLKERVEASAAQEGLSVNTWLVRAVAGALDRHPTAPVTPRDTGRRVTGWVR